MRRPALAAEPAPLCLGRIGKTFVSVEEESEFISRCRRFYLEFRIGERRAESKQASCWGLSLTARGQGLRPAATPGQEGLGGCRYLRMRSWHPASCCWRRMSGHAG